MRLILCKQSTVAGWNWPAWATRRLQEQFPAVEFVEFDEDDPGWQGEVGRKAAQALFATAEAVVAWRLAPELLHAAVRLRWIHSPAAGVQPLLALPELIERPIALTNGAEVHAVAVAEHALAFILALARRLPAAVRQQERREWDVEVFRRNACDLTGAQVLIVGLGHIGRELARRLVALGMTVEGIRRHPAHTSGGVKEYPPEALRGRLALARFVVLALPATETTRALLGEEEIAAMRPDAYLVNVGRGSALDEAALTSALLAGRLAGAALDVFAEEPLPPASPLWACERVLITPHVAAASPGLWPRQVALIARHLERILAGETEGAEALPFPSMDKRRGY